MIPLFVAGAVIGLFGSIIVGAIGWTGGLVQAVQLIAIGVFRFAVLTVGCLSLDWLAKGFMFS